MLILLIRYLMITLCIHFSYYKLLNKEIKKTLTPILFVISIIMGSIFYILSPTFRFVVPTLHIVLLFCVYLYNDIKTEVPETIFTSLILSYSISYICYFSSVVLTAVPSSFIYTYLIKTNRFGTINSQVVISLIQYLLCYALFCSKRLRNGIPYLRNPFLSQLGVFIGILIIGFTMYFSTMDTSSNSTDIPYIASLFAFCILSILIFFWWKNISHQSYLLQAKERECIRLKEQLSCCEEKLNTLETENNELSKLIHRDNKLIPSLQLAVQELITEAGNEQTANRLLIQLNEEMTERKSLLTHLSQNRKKFPDTGIPSLNQLLSYIQQRCIAHSVFFDCNFSTDISSVLTDIHCPSEKELSTLLADMLENALISTLHHKGERIFLLMEKETEGFRIEIWDSGDKFSKDVLYYMGKKRHTTHKSEGGSGIGLMVTWELLKKYQASLIIDEETSSDNFFTKKVVICFDQKDNYILCSHRSKEELSFLKYRQDLQIREK